MKVSLISIPVSNQDKALKFYTEKLGFIINKDIPIENGNRWLTLVSPEWKDGPELLLEPAPINFEPSKVYQDALMEAGITYTKFDVDSADAEYDDTSNYIDFTSTGFYFSTSQANADINAAGGTYIYLAIKEN